jgi:hypothetical protein
MSNVQRNQKKPSKYKHGGRAGIEVALVRCAHFPYKYFSFPSMYCDGMVNGCVLCDVKNKKARSPSLIEITAIVGHEFEHTLAKIIRISL